MKEKKTVCRKRCKYCPKRLSHNKLGVCDECKKKRRDVYIERFKSQRKEQKEQELVLLTKAKSVKGMVSINYITNFTDDKLVRHLEQITKGMVIPTW